MTLVSVCAPFGTLVVLLLVLEQGGLEEEEHEKSVETALMVIAKRTELRLAESKKRSELANSRRAIPGELSEILHARKAMSYGGCAIATGNLFPD